jgi:hypothetical protein
METRSKAASSLHRGAKAADNEAGVVEAVGGTSKGMTVVRGAKAIVAMVAATSRAVNKGEDPSVNGLANQNARLARRVNGKSKK